MRSIENPMLINFESTDPDFRWQECLTLIEEEYNYSIKDMCKDLKCSRTWFNTYVKPYLHYIYLSNGKASFRKDDTPLRPNFVKMANYELAQRGNINISISSSNLYSKEEFNKLIIEHIKDTTRQTIKVPIELLIKQDKLDEFSNKFENYTWKTREKKIEELINNRSKDSEITKYKKEWIIKRDELLNKYLSEKGLAIMLNHPSEFERGKTKAYKVKLKKKDLIIDKFMAIHDLKDYGDTDEEIYRDLFKKGCVRLVVELPDQNGKVSEKVYYIDVDEDIKEVKSSLELELIEYKWFRKFPELFKPE